MNTEEKKTTLYDYLEPILEHGTEEQITLARKKYWNDYKAAWRKNRRKEQKEFTISFTPKELQLLKQSITKHTRSYTRFIKEAALAYCQQQFLVTDPMAISQIKELLALNYNALQQQTEENILSTETGTELMQKMGALETQVLTTLYNPQTLEQWIQEVTSDNPEYRVKLIELLNMEKK
jgi:hypothetical protein